MENRLLYNWQGTKEKFGCDEKSAGGNGAYVNCSKKEAEKKKNMIQIENAISSKMVEKMDIENGEINISLSEKEEKEKIEG